MKEGVAVISSFFSQLFLFFLEMKERKKNFINKSVRVSIPFCFQFSPPLCLWTNYTEKFNPNSPHRVCLCVDGYTINGGWFNILPLFLKNKKQQKFVFFHPFRAVVCVPFVFQTEKKGQGAYYSSL